MLDCAHDVMERFDEWRDDRDEVVTDTFLTRKPAPQSSRIAAVSVLVLLVGSMLYWSDALGASALFPASRRAVYVDGELWRLLTSLVAHADIQHFLSNAIVFGVLAYLLYGYYGAVVYPGLTVLFGAITTALALRTYPATTLLVGASGVVYLMAGFWLALYLLIERRVRFGKRLIRAVGFGVIILFPTVIEPSVSYRTHFIGFLVGVSVAFAYYSKHRERLRSYERIVYEYH